MRRSDLNRFWKITFYGLLAFFLLSLGSQLYEYMNVNLITDIHLAATWDQAKKTLGWYTLVFLAMNLIAYKIEIYDTSKNQIVNGIVACSVLVLLYYSLSHLLLPYLFFAQMGRLDLFLVP
jgi:hypothetical protein